MVTTSFNSWARRSAATVVFALPLFTAACGQPYDAAASDDLQQGLNATGGVAGTGGVPIFVPPTDSVLRRLTPTGDVDPSFATGGEFVSTNPAHDALTQVQTSGDKILAAGYVKGALNHNVMLARFTRDGIPDTSFGYAGVTAVSLLGQVDPAPRGIAQDGAGNISVLTPTSIIRFTPNGLPDTGFGNSGVASLPADVNPAVGLFALASGQLIVAGTRVGQMVVVKYTNGGAFDGTVTLTPGVATALAPHADGLVVAGFEGNQAKAVRCSVFGLRDANFGVLALNLPNAPTRFHAVASHQDGRLVFVGDVRAPSKMFLIVRTTGFGVLDSSFGIGGLVFSGDPARENTALAVRTVGNAIVFAGTVSQSGAVVVGLSGTGQPIPNFGSSGRVTLPISFVPQALAVDGIARPLVAGHYLR